MYPLSPTTPNRSIIWTDDLLSPTTPNGREDWDALQARLAADAQLEAEQVRLKAEEETMSFIYPTGSPTGPTQSYSNPLQLNLPREPVEEPVKKSIDRDDVRLFVEDSDLVAGLWIDSGNVKFLRLHTQYTLIAKIMNVIAWLFPHRCYGSAEISIDKKIYYVRKSEIMNTLDCPDTVVCPEILDAKPHSPEQYANIVKFYACCAFI